MPLCTMDTLKIGEKAIIKDIDKSSSMKKRLFELGFIPGAKVECVLISPLGDPKAFLIKNTVMALREEDSQKITVNIVECFNDE